MENAHDHRGYQKLEEAKKDSGLQVSERMHKFILAAITKYLQLSSFNKRNFYFFTHMEARSPPESLTGLVSCKDPPGLQVAGYFLGSHMVLGGALSGVSSHKNTNPIRREPHLYDLIYL